MREEEKIRKLKMDMQPKPRQKSPSTRKKEHSREHSKASDTSYRSSPSRGKKLIAGKDGRAGSGFNIIATNNKVSSDGSPQ